MRTQLLLTVLLIQLTLAWPVSAQVYSAKRLTQRIAPQTAPAPAAAPHLVAAQPAVLPVQAPANPAKSEAENDETARRIEQFHKGQADQALESSDEADVHKPASPPLLVECKQVKPDPNDSLQTISLSLTNSLPKAVSRLTLRMIYCDANGKELKEWITRRALDVPVPARTAMELDQPAYFMPLVTRHVKVEVKEVLFSDGTSWPQSAN